jgi:4-amino-4-deoxy-L-arabinose transferase-like glycosyltransferase
MLSSLHRSCSVPGLLPIALVAWILRLMLLVVKCPGLPAFWGGEMASVASALARGEGFSSPYWIATGATAIVPPVYPFFLSLVFRIFGIHTDLSGQVIFFLGACFSALVTVPIFLIGRRSFGLATGWIGAVLWALYPLSGFSEVLYNWDSAFFALLLALFFWAALEMKASRTMWTWCGFGLLAGLTVLTETVALLFVVAVLVYVTLKEQMKCQKVLIAFAAVLIVTVPWTLRNSLVFGQPVFLRTNLGLELYRGLSENDFANITDPRRLPGRDPVEMASYRELGEIAYMQTKLSTVLTFIAQHPAQYSVRTIKRALAFWAGDAYVVTIYWFFGRFAVAKHMLYSILSVLALFGLGFGMYRRLGSCWLFLFLTLTHPLIYYFSSRSARYRAPMEPELVVLSAFALAQVSALYRARLGRACRGDVSV